MESNATPPENTVSEEDSHHNKIHSFYFVKMSQYEDPNLAAADKLIHKLNQERVLINENRSLKMMDRDKLCDLCRVRRNRMQYCLDWNFSEDNMKVSQLCLDKLQFANNSSRGRAIKPSSSVKEIDHHSLHFGLIHGSKKLSEEKQILRKIKEVEKLVDECISVDDYNRKIALARPRWPFEKILTGDNQRRLEEVKKLKQQKEEAVAGAALHGKMWKSLGSKQNLIQQIQSGRVHMERGIPKLIESKKELVRQQKQLASIEKYLSCLKKQSISIEQLKDEIAEWIPQYQKRQLDKNVCYGSYITLMRHARELAENKQVVAVQSLSHQQVEEFMSRWNSTDKDFRDDYKARSVVSLNKWCLTGDGRHRNCGEKLIVAKAPAIEISKSLRGALGACQIT